MLYIWPNLKKQGPVMQTTNFTENIVIYIIYIIHVVHNWIYQDKKHELSRFWHFKHKIKSEYVHILKEK